MTNLQGNELKPERRITKQILVVKKWAINRLSFENAILLLYHRIVPESARWLIIRGRLAEAEDILSSIARKNGIAVPKILLQVSRPLSVVGNRYGCLDLLSNMKIAKITIVLFYLWWVSLMFRIHVIVTCSLQ